MVRPPTTMSESLIRRYYDCFNARRFAEAAALFAEDADIEVLPSLRGHGGAGYLRVAEAWVTAFPNATFVVERVEQQSETVAEAHLLATGTHLGALNLGTYWFEPTGTEARLHVRELLDIRANRIHRSFVTVDINDLLPQLVRVDYRELARHVASIVALNEELSHAIGDVTLERTVVARLGAELDAARNTLRPYFRR